MIIKFLNSTKFNNKLIFSTAFGLLHSYFVHANRILCWLIINCLVICIISCEENCSYACIKVIASEKKKFACTVCIYVLSAWDCNNTSFKFGIYSVSVIIKKKYIINYFGDNLKLTLRNLHSSHSWIFKVRLLKKLVIGFYRC